MESRIISAANIDRLWSEYRIGTADEAPLALSANIDTDAVSAPVVGERMRFDAFAVCLLDLAAHITTTTSSFGHADGQDKELQHCVGRTEEFINEILQETKSSSKGPPYVLRIDFHNILRRYFQMLRENS